MWSPSCLATKPEQASQCLTNELGEALFEHQSMKVSLLG